MLEIQKLHASYRNDVILDGIDLSLEPGGSLAIIGESGAGKTTLGRCIMRLVEARTAGSIIFNGHDLLAASEDEMRTIRWNRISIVFQNVDNILNPVYAALDQVAEPMIEHKLFSKEQACERARELMSRFGLPDRRFHAYPHELSGGEQQRVLLAMAFANDPDLVIMDEPLSSLDVTARHELAGILEKDAGQCARLVITHDLDTARRLADNIAVLYGGRIVESGSSTEVLTNPRHPYTRALLRAFPNMTTVKDLQGIRGRMSRPFGPGCPFQPRCTQSIECCKTELPLLRGDGRKVACHRGGIVTRLAVQELTVRYGDFTAVDDLYLDVMAGETVALVGESGSGKTTLAKAVIGLQPPQSGEIYLEGRKIKNNDLDFHRRVQMVFQNPGDSLSHRLSVVELVMEPLDVQKTGTKEERREKAMQSILETELPVTDDFLNTYPHHLSGGELQRVAIARALVTSPDLLIADEPTAFLDAGVGAKILKLLLNLQEQHGLSLLFITHDIAAARKVSDRIAVMAKGKIVEFGPAAKITIAPQSPVTRALLEAAGRLESKG